MHKRITSIIKQNSQKGYCLLYSEQGYADIHYPSPTLRFPEAILNKSKKEAKGKKFELYIFSRKLSLSLNNSSENGRKDCFQAYSGLAIEVCKMHAYNHHRTKYGAGF
jgi:hypothetical protein